MWILTKIFDLYIIRVIIEFDKIYRSLLLSIIAQDYCKKTSYVVYCTRKGKLNRQNVLYVLKIKFYYCSMNRILDANCICIRNS